jgi:hypothetical protein
MAINEGDILRIVASLVFPDDVIMQNVFHMVATTIVGDGNEEDITEDAVGYIDDIYEEHEANIDDTIDGDEIKVYVWDSVDQDWDEIGTGLMTITAAAVGDAMPHGCALLQTFFTSDPDVQGRKYWGGFGEGNHADGDWSGTVLANIVLAAADVITTVTGVTTGSTFQPAVWSPKNENAFLYSGVVVTNSVVAYQRRRKPGVGI